MAKPRRSTLQHFVLPTFRSHQKLIFSVAASISIFITPFCSSLSSTLTTSTSPITVAMASQMASTSSSSTPSLSMARNEGKTVYLIRHAETEENVRMFALQDVVNSFKNGKLPKKEDVKHGFDFLGMQLSGHTDSVLSRFGMAQVRELHNVLMDEGMPQQQHQDNNDVGTKHWVQELDLIAHSPLQRARETCMGAFGIPSTVMGMDDTIATKPLTPLRQIFPPVVELDCLEEVTPFEKFFGGGKKSVKRRIKQLEDWIESHDNDDDDGKTVSTIAIVGHSEYFQIMLEKAGMNKKPQNCDVWRAVYHNGGKWSDLRLIHRLTLPSPTPDTAEAKMDTDVTAVDVVTGSNNKNAAKRQ